MKRINLIVGALLFLLAFYPAIQTAKSQNPVVDLGAEGLRITGGGIVAMINTLVETIGASGGLLGALISIVLGIVNGFCSFILSLVSSSIVSCITSFMSSGLISTIMSVVSGILSGIVSMISSVFCGELFSVLNCVSGLLTAACCVPNTLLYLAWWVIFIILNLWTVLGFVGEILILLVQLVVGGILGIIGMIAGAIPLVSVLYGILAAILFIIWAAVWTAWDIACYGLPSGILVALAGLCTVIATTYMPEVSKNYLAVMGFYLANFGTYAASFGMMFAVEFGGILLPAASSWCGGMQGGAQWVLAWGAAILGMAKIVVVGIVWLGLTILAIIATLLAIPSALLQAVRNVCGV